jgi:biotin synthase-related radical SAM superfamily protein
MKPRSDPIASKEFPKLLRVSLGTAISLGLTNGKLQAFPTTAYLMTHNPSKCSANCSFCPQARDSHGSASMLSRVSWPIVQTNAILEAINRDWETEHRIRRVCIQTLNYKDVFDHVSFIVTKIRRQCGVPISVSCQPSCSDELCRLAEAGVQRVGIPLDAATENIFDCVKGSQAGGPYRWERQFQLLKQALGIFGEGNVSTHLIVGLGETEQEMVKTVQDCVDIGVLPGLFAFTPVSGTKMQNTKQPPIQTYRRIQVARLIVLSKISRFENMRFAQGQITDFGISKDALERIVDGGEAFRTCGCPDCNRPYYNERPTGPIYNYPAKLKSEELAETRKQICLGRECFLKDMQDKQ